MIPRPRQLRAGAAGAVLAAMALATILASARTGQQAIDQQLQSHAARHLARADEHRIAFGNAADADLMLPGGDRRRVHSLLKLAAPLRHGDYVWNDTGSGGRVWIRIDLERQLISVFREGDEIGTALVIFGMTDRLTPIGEFAVIAKAADHYSRSYDAPMPFMLRLTHDGVAIHASQVRADRATHGCLGVPLGFAEKLYAAADTGTPVYILSGKEAA